MDGVMQWIQSWNPALSQCSSPSKFIRGIHVKVVVLTILITSILFYTSPYVLEPVHLQSISVKHAPTYFEGTLAEIEETSTEIDGEFDQTAFRELCDSKEWIEGLVFDCMPPQGGIGNVRNVFMNCMRYAIEGGAGVIVSGVIARDDTDLSKLTTTNIVPFSSFFDELHFVNTLKSACPQMKVYLSAESVEHQDQVARPFPALHFNEPQEYVQGTVLAHPEQWRGRFDSWLSSEEIKEVVGHDPTADLPSIINIGTPLLQFPLAGDSKGFTSQFGRIFKFRHEIRVLAAVIIQAMSDGHELGINKSEAGIKKRAYYGAHLRTAADAVKAGWQTYEQQSNEYLESAKREGLSDYLCTGWAVTTKMDLLDLTEHKEMLKSLTWDQQGLIDYEVLLYSSAFGGISTSSFAWNIALRRHVIAEREGKGQDYLETDFTLKDEYSTLFGERGEGPWFWAGMWP